MKNIILPLILTLMPVAAVAAPNHSYHLLSAGQQSSIDRMCSTHVGVEYGSDDMTDEQYWEFDDCRNTLADGLVHTRPVILRPHPIRIPF